MARGKHTCKILKEIRRQIAEANSINFVTSECHYKGDCPGTCPKCESEVRYLEQQLRVRQRMGKAVIIAGISVDMIALSGCGLNDSKTMTINSEMQRSEPIEVVDTLDFDGEIEDIEEEDETPAIENPFSNSDVKLSEVVLGEVPDDTVIKVTKGEISDTLLKDSDENGVYCNPDQQPEFTDGDTDQPIDCVTSQSQNSIL